MAFEQLQKDIKAGKIYPVYLFHGEESYLIDEAVSISQARTSFSFMRSAARINPFCLIASNNFVRLSIDLPLWQRTNTLLGAGLLT